MEARKKYTILIDINHPGHVHFYRNLIQRLHSEGHKVITLASEKDITIQLLKEYEIPYLLSPKIKKGIFGKILSLIQKDIHLIYLSLKFNPDIYTGIASIPSAHVSWIFRKRCLIFDDTEHSKYEIALYKPFVKEIYTPSCFQKDLGKKQIRYEGFHELAYLHPSVFKPDPNVVIGYGIDPESKYFILRFIGWNAFHDRNQIGMTFEEKRELVNYLLKFGRVFISSEETLPPEFEPYRLKMKFKDIHHGLAYATLFIGESGTMATEASILGTFSIIINPLAKECGNFIEIQNIFNLIKYFDSYTDAKETIIFKLINQNQKVNADKDSEKLIKSKIDVTQFINEKFKIDTL